jgi:hypothetical protein
MRVATDIARLQNRIGAKDKERLDVHLTNIRSIEQRISQGTVSPPPASCSMQTRPLAVRDMRNKEDITRRNELMSDLLTVTLACDLTRVFSVQGAISLRTARYRIVMIVKV